MSIILSGDVILTTDFHAKAKLQHTRGLAPCAYQLFAKEAQGACHRVCISANPPANLSAEGVGPSGPCGTDGTVTSCLIGIDLGGTWQQSPGVTRCLNDGSDIAGIFFQSKTCPCDCNQKPVPVIEQLAWGGDWGGMQGVDESALPITMEVDHIRVFQKK